MISLSRKKLEALIRLSDTIEEADERIVNYLEGKPTLGEKIAFLRGMYDDVDLIVSGHSNKYDECLYNDILRSLIYSS